MSELLEVRHLSVGIHTPAGTVQAVRDVSFSLSEGEVLAIVGESGCGKSILCRSLIGLLPKQAAITGGQILAAGQDLTAYTEAQLQPLRGRLLAMVFQDPLSALNPTMTVGRQIAEAVRLHGPGLSRTAVNRQVLSLMDRVGIADPAVRSRQYPAQFSGGMCQRIVLAIALAGKPRILLADEPTTALDVTIQAQILELLKEIRRQERMSTILVSHDLGVVARAADRVAIMYAGQLVEIGTADEVYEDPRHPYTWGLLQALPAYARRSGRLQPIAGMPPSLLDPPPGDAFACRNPLALAIDYERQPPLFEISPTHFAATWLLDPRAPAVRNPITGGMTHGNPSC